MVTVLYDKNNIEILSQHDEGYFVDGVKPELPTNIVELTVVKNSIPSFDSKTQYLEEEWTVDLEDKEYILSYNIINKTEQQLAIEDWKFPDYSKRIIAPKSMITEDIGVKMFSYFQLNDLPIEKLTSTVRLYTDTISPQNTWIITQYNLTVEDRPEL